MVILRTWILHFEIVDHSNYTVTVIVSKQENLYTVVCNPEAARVDIQDLAKAQTKLTISDLYGTPDLQCYEQGNPGRVYNNGDILQPIPLGYLLSSVLWIQLKAVISVNSW